MYVAARPSAIVGVVPTHPAGGRAIARRHARSQGAKTSCVTGTKPSAAVVPPRSKKSSSGILTGANKQEDRDPGHGERRAGPQHEPAAKHGPPITTKPEMLNGSVPPQVSLWC